MSNEDHDHARLATGGCQHGLELTMDIARRRFV
jgi:hypothetical protein